MWSKMDIQGQRGLLASGELDFPPKSLNLKIRFYIIIKQASFKPAIFPIS